MRLVLLAAFDLAQGDTVQPSFNPFVEVLVEPAQKIPGDILVLGMLSALRTLVLVLSKHGVIEVDEYVTALQQTAAEHRQTGDPNNLANAIHAISIHILSSATQRG